MGGTLITERELVSIFLLSIFTLRIYAKCWIIVFQFELEKETDKGFDGFGHFIMLIFTFLTIQIKKTYKTLVLCYD